MGDKAQKNKKQKTKCYNGTSRYALMKGMDMPLPKITELDLNKWPREYKRLFICASGFEKRSLAFLKKLPTNNNDVNIENVLLINYLPVLNSLKTDIIDCIKSPIKSNIDELDFSRFEPADFENAMRDYLTENAQKYSEIIIDISVMSKLMIIIILWLLREYSLSIRIVYSEPKTYAPTKEQYNQQKPKLALPSLGVHDAITTPELSSVIMSSHPNLIMTFTSFNEQLIRALLSSFTPSRLFLIGSRPPRLTWREKAAQDIHKDLLADYPDDNPIDDNGLLLRTSSTFEYSETFDILANAYKENCYDYRLVVAPTGSKMQAVGVALFKICCYDIHIEYPTPASYYWNGYSSDDIHSVYELSFNSFNVFTSGLSEEYNLNG
jgi:hypothetical protein